MQIHLSIYHPKHAGILSAAIELKADQVILLHRKEDDISGLKASIQARGIKCISELITFQTQMVREQLVRLIETHHQHKLILNASSSYNKLTLIAFEQFNVFSLPVFMVDKFVNQLIWLKTSANLQVDPSEDVLLGHPIKLKEYLKSFNTQVIDMGQSTPEPESSRSLTQWIIAQLGTADKAIASLNYIAMHASNSLRYQLSQHELKNQSLMNLLAQFETADKLTVHGRKLKFKDQESRFYSNGGWLENHVFSLLYGLRKNRPAISDLAKGLTIVRNQGRVKNELDVAAICHNRLHIFECKTRHFKNTRTEKSDANSAIYRLDTIKSISGGHSGKAMLISYQKLNKYTLSRAQDLGIYCCSHTQLKQLERHLYQFIDQATIN